MDYTFQLASLDSQTSSRLESMVPNHHLILITLSPQMNQILHSSSQTPFSLVLFLGFIFIPRSSFNFFEDHIMTVNCFPCYRIPQFVTFYSIFVTKEDTFLCFIIQPAPFFLWNMHKSITPKISEICNKRLLTKPYLMRNLFNQCLCGWSIFQITCSVNNYFP